MRKLLDEAGITCGIVGIWACYAGGFMPALKHDHTLVITATRADRASFKRWAGDAGTLFPKPSSETALARPTMARLPAAAGVAARKRRERVTPLSEPQIALEAAMAEKLKEFERGSAARRAGRMLRLEGPRTTTAPTADPHLG